ncbi:MAG TPA: amidohydrolase family protein, partial [Myxococcaceae bacterium]|nr:amidohydrolase family protein [Myxococcaceae bacterium]
MEGRLVLKNGAILEGDGRLRTAVAVLVVGGRIAQIDDDARIPVLPGDWEVACRGRLIAPGRVDAHAHLVGDLLPAVSEGERERLACRLGASEVEVLTALGLARAALAGATLVCEHLRAPYCVGAALAAQQRVAGTLRLRLVHSHACADAEGGRSALAQLEESAAYASAVQGDSRVRSALGCGRASLLSDELMRETGRLSQSLGVGVHFHA